MRALVIVLDSVGCGHAPDADAYGDSGANTLGHILAGPRAPRLDTLRALGLDLAMALAAGSEPPNLPCGWAAGAMTGVSAGKDTTTGHWEIAGVILPEPFAVFSSFPAGLVAAIEEQARVRFLGNVAASGTEIIERLGARHLETGRPILYTSADSVLQIAAHEDVIPVARLYKICEVARQHADRWRIGRVIARPFAGHPGSFARTPRRHDFSMLPPRTVLDALRAAGHPVTGIGKISDIFAGRGIDESFPTAGNRHGMQTIMELWTAGRQGLLFANLVDFDMLFGHRRDLAGYARALDEFDRWLGDFLPEVGADDLLIVTADHGNDPVHPGTDHTRERVPLLVRGGGITGGLGVRDTFADVAASLAAWFPGCAPWPNGNSFLPAPAPCERSNGTQ